MVPFWPHSQHESRTASFVSTKKHWSKCTSQQQEETNFLGCCIAPCISANPMYNCGSYQGPKCGHECYGRRETRTIAAMGDPNLDYKDRSLLSTLNLNSLCRCPVLKKFHNVSVCKGIEIPAGIRASYTGHLVTYTAADMFLANQQRRNTVSKM